MFKTFFLYSIVISLLFLSSCETKINLNTDYETTPIVFGLLDHADSIHYIKITKTFLGNGNNYEYAQIPDSSYFRNVNAKIIELFDGEVTGREWILKDSIIKTKAAGIFYNEEQKVYVFYANDLKQDHEYKLEADLNEGELKIDATTNLIDGFTYNLFGMDKLNLAALNASTNDNYKIVKIFYKEALNAQRYQTYFNITIRETYLDGSSKDKVLTWSAPLYNGLSDNDIDPLNPSQQNQVISFSGEGFYIFLQSELEIDENVMKREFVKADLVTDVGHLDLVRYMSTSDPSSSLSQTTPLFTNINGGLGLFSSRHKGQVKDLGMISSSVEELCIGQYTNLLKFCSNLPEHHDKLFYCD